MNVKGMTKDEVVKELKKCRKQIEHYKKKESECRSAETALGRKIAMFRSLFDQVSDSIFIMEWEKRKGPVIVDANIAACSTYGYKRRDLVGSSIRRLKMNETARHIRELMKRLYKGEQFIIEGEHTHRDGSVFPVEISLQAVKLGEQTFIMSIHRNIADRKKLEERFKAASITDELTGLLNRRGFTAFAQKQIAISKRHKRNFSVLYIDLNDLKVINDDFGHQEGDRALTGLANTLRNTFRASDIIARMGGDEFAIFIIEPNRTTIEHTVRKNLEKQIRAYNEKEGRPYDLSISMGVVHFDPYHPSSLDELLASADELMYRDKVNQQFKKVGIKPPKNLGGEKRVGRRLPLDQDYTAELVIPEDGVIRNISPKGICMRTSQRLSKNSIYRIRLGNDGPEEVEPKGIVVWTSLVGETPPEGGMRSSYESGLRFIDLNERAKKFLSSFITNISA
jgi:diguanylate cyclase (GGDEF)-like protein/PAS domain S-box-containing protein